MKAAGVILAVLIAIACVRFFLPASFYTLSSLIILLGLTAIYLQRRERRRKPRQ